MKIAYSHLVGRIKENPSIDEISKSLFQLGHEHEIEGTVFDIEFTPNRGDCLSVNGLLRDLSVFYTVETNQDIYSDEINELQLDFENLSPDACPRITFLKLEIDKNHDHFVEKYFHETQGCQNDLINEENYSCHQDHW